jgi:serine/threonine protein kinase
MDILKNNIIQDKYTVVEKIGNGKFGTVYLGYSDKEKVAIKFDNSLLGILKHEVKILYYLNEKNSIGIPKIYWYGISPIHFPCFVMPYYDCTLRNYVSIQSNKTYILGMINNMLSILNNIHNSFVIHRDLKPDNFMIKNGEIFLIDFGLATFYIDGKTGIHVECNNNREDIIGTLIYASYNIHLGHTHSRRDDCIQLCYIFLYIILGGSLPWEIKYIPAIIGNNNIVQTNIYHPYNQERCKMKELSNICLIPELNGKKLNETERDENIQLFIVYIAKCYKLKYDDTPTYIL